jgi:hypothetical protein
LYGHKNDSSLIQENLSGWSKSMFCTVYFWALK